ncbi:MAG: cardiolipin synthase [Alphaproteobacteria bacterium]|nr:cardiolipin synthase [Alphaproteobacteria bacterium]
MTEYLQQYWAYTVTGFVFAFTIVLSAFVILYKRNERAAIAWVGLIILSPIIGSIAYFLLGINRIKRRAVRIRPHALEQLETLEAAQTDINKLSSKFSSIDSSSTISDCTKGPTLLINSLTANPLTQGNSIIPLVNGDAAYPEMLEAIRKAKHSLCFETYIFKYDEVGKQFVEELGNAVKRGVEVRVLIDGVGQIYSWPPIVRALNAEGIPNSRFMYSLWPWRMPYLNLRNHQKILVIDGEIGFTGGMNISAANAMDTKINKKIRDIHFKLEGPLVAHLTEAFADDWHLTTNESLVGSIWFPVLINKGNIVARGITSGPHESFERMRWILAAAISEARKSLCIMTPYFLPDETISAGLRLAALRGVEVDIILPEKNNMPFINWAAMARIDELVSVGCRVWLGKSPFNHSKLLLVDNYWALFGSSNWDPRSLILNFEFNVECQGKKLVRQLSSIFDLELAQSRSVSLSELNNRSFLVKLRDGIARMCSPYL